MYSEYFVELKNLFSKYNILDEYCDNIINDIQQGLPEKEFSQIEFYDYFKTKNLAEKNHIRIVHNTPKEIAQVALEMHQRLKGEWITTQEDLELQSEFNKIFDKGNSHFTSKYCPSRIGALFLRENLSLL